MGVIKTYADLEVINVSFIGHVPRDLRFITCLQIYTS
jgi:hypothetical protein